ncbi:MAG: hypothetical protein U0802_15285 [Candidatus Binatia bacterium]
MIDNYATVVLSSGEVVSTMASWIDAPATAPAGGTAAAPACCRRSPS